METRTNKRHKNFITISFNNAVDKDVQSVLLPLNLMQNVVCFPKYRIKHDIITPNSLFSNLVSIIAVVVAISVFTYSITSVYFTQDYSESTAFLYGSCLYDFLFYLLGFSINFVIGVVQTIKSINFVLTFQEVHRYLNCETSFNRFIIWNWIIVIFALCGHFVVVTVFCKLSCIPCISIFACYMSIAFDVNMLYAIRIIKLLESKLILWSIHVINFEVSENTHRESDSKKSFRAYVDLLECYSIHKDCFQLYVSNSNS